MLSKAKRKKYFKALGLGDYTRSNISKLQSTYFTRKPDIDGEYGKNTDKLLVNLYRIKKYAPHFKITEFKCHCDGKYCTGYPSYISVALLKNLEKIRTKFGVTHISSGIRCKKWNQLQTGSVSTSRHMSGKAVDVWGSYTKTDVLRGVLKDYWYALEDSNYCYYGTPNMGIAVHLDVK